MPSSSNSTELANTTSRYAHLLEPIRELERNWSIDIASELEDYLAELEAITIAFEDGKRLDFAEAALVIQGSTCIYGKKVDSLYELVLNTLDQVIHKKKEKEQQQRQRQQQEQQDDEPVQPEDGEEEPFVTLDDTLKEADNISLASAAGGAGAAHADTRAFTLAAAPLSLFASLGGGDGECKMHTCAMHPSGALLLPHVAVAEHILQALPMPARGPAAAPHAADRDATMAADEEPTRGEFDDEDNREMQPDDDDGWEAAEMAVSEAVPPATQPIAPDPADFAEFAEAEETVPPTPGAPPPTPAPPLTPAPQRARQSIERDKRPAASPFDPWKPLDPHDNSGISRRPWRRGKTYKPPPPLGATVGAEESTEAADEAERDEAEREEGADTPKGGAGVDKENGGASGASTVLRRLGLLPAALADSSPLGSLRAPLWPQFEAIHAAATKQRAAVRRDLLRELRLKGHVPELEEAEDGADKQLGDGGDKERDGAAAGAGEVEGDLLDPHLPASMLIDPTEDDFAEDDGGYGGGMDAEEEEDVEEEEKEATTRGDETSYDETSYEERCRLHVEQCLEASASYLEDADLHRRVAAWQARVEPLLQEQHCRPQYDVHEYADRLLRSFVAEGRTVARSKKSRAAEAGSAADGGEVTCLSFGEAAQAQKPYEVARMFLAALVLSNSENVQLHASGSLAEGNLKLDLHLLKSERRQQHDLDGVRGPHHGAHA